MHVRFWLLAMDAIARCGLYGSPLYLWAVGKASDATDWTPGAKLGDEEPF